MICINYQVELDKIILKEKDRTPSLLLQACCAPCSSYVLEYLSSIFNITILYYNPNISPYTEYLKRLNEVQKLISEMPLKNKVTILECSYDNDKFLDMVKGKEELKEGGLRCFDCYKLRLEYTAKVAKENNFDYFGTTLSISPYKNSTWLNEIGSELEKEYNIKYLYSDFKKKNGYKRSIELSKIYNLYRQDYCGCIFSKRDREIEKKEERGKNNG